MQVSQEVTYDFPDIKLPTGLNVIAGLLCLYLFTQLVLILWSDSVIPYNRRAPLRRGKGFYRLPKEGSVA